MKKKLGLRFVSCYFVRYLKMSKRYKFYDLLSRSFFEIGNVKFIEYNESTQIKEVIFEEEYINTLIITSIKVTGNT